MKPLLLVSFCIVFITNLFATDTLQINPNKCKTDFEKGIILCNQNLASVNYYYKSYSYLNLHNGYSFAEPINQFTTDKGYTVLDSNNQQFTLYFTTLPIVEINTPNLVNDTIATNAVFSLTNYNLYYDINEFIEIEYRGSWSLNLNPKSYKIKFKTDTVNKINKDVSLLNMRLDQEWNLQAMANEPLKLRSKSSYLLWQQIHTLYYKNLEPNLVNGVNMEYAELFFNGNYIGVYAVSERIDRKQLKLKKFNNTIRGELYKGVDNLAALTTEAPIFDSNSIYWHGFLKKYPEDIIDWTNLHHFISFAKASQDVEFYNYFGNYFNMANAVDYFIFINMVGAVDNTGKNLYLARYNRNEPYFYVPYDLDGTFGLNYDGSRSYTYDYVISNGIYHRLLNCNQSNFATLLKQRWNELRVNTIRNINLNNLVLNNYNILQQNGVFLRDNYSNKTNNEAEELTYISNWIGSRISFLDNYFNQLCTSNSIQKTAINKPIMVYPNPATDKVYITNISKGKATLFNTLGIQVLTTNITEENNSLLLTGLPSGMYILNIDGKQPFTTKIFIK